MKRPSKLSRPALVAAVFVAGCAAHKDPPAASPPAPPPGASSQPAQAAEAASASASAREDKSPPAAPLPLKGEVVDTKIVLRGSITFDNQKATLKEKESLEALEQLKAFLANNPQVNVVRIEGHASEANDRIANIKLSGARAFSVVAWLVANGVPRTRLVAVGIDQAHGDGPGAKDAAASKSPRIEAHVAVLNGKNFLDRDPTGGGTVFR